jgi:hypothetical protein
MAKRKLKKATIDEIIPDDKNFNQGNEIGRQMLSKSFKKFGAGRSILLDKNNRTIAGNKSVEGFIESGGKNVLIVEADRDTLVAVRRSDLDLDTAEGREFALADNQTQAVNYVPDEELVNAIAEELNIDTGEWGLTMDEETHTKKLKEEELRPFKRTHILISFSPERLLELQPHLEAIKKIDGVEFEQGSN